MTREIEYDQVVADTICEAIADGKSLRSICKDKGFPAKSTVFKWLAAVPAFADQYARAREAQADSYADDIADIADDRSLEPNDKRVRIDTRKWLAGKLRPKVYGDASTVKHTGAIGSFDASKYTDEQLARLEDVLAASAASAGDAEGDQSGEAETSG